MNVEVVAATVAAEELGCGGHGGGEQDDGGAERRTWRLRAGLGCALEGAIILFSMNIARRAR